MEALSRQIVFDEKVATVQKETQWGTRYSQTIEIVGVDGQKASIESIWQRDLDGDVRLITATPD